MRLMSAFLGVSVFLMVAALGAVLIATSLAPADRDARLLMASGDNRDDGTEEPLRLSALGAPLPAAAHGVVVGDSTYIVLRVDDATIDAARDRGWHLPPLTKDPRGGALMAFDARGTYLGCSAGLLPDGLREPGLWLIDPCHQGLFNALDDGAAKPGSPNRGPLTAAKVVLGGSPDPTISIIPAPA